jgi:hypothetical protein
MNYYLRHSSEFKGAMSAIIGAAIAGQLMNEGKGKWVEREFVNKGKKSIFVFDEACVFTVGGRSGAFSVQLMIWEGSYLELVD